MHTTLDVDNVSHHNFVKCGPIVHGVLSVLFWRYDVLLTAWCTRSRHDVLLDVIMSLWEFPPILVANPAVTRKGSQFVSGASREQTYIYIVVKCYCVIRPANT